MLNARQGITVQVVQLRYVYFYQYKTKAIHIAKALMPCLL